LAGRTGSQPVWDDESANPKRLLIKRHAESSENRRLAGLLLLHNRLTPMKPVTFTGKRILVVTMIRSLHKDRQKLVEKAARVLATLNRQAGCDRDRVLLSVALP